MKVLNSLVIIIVFCLSGCATKPSKLAPPIISTVGVESSINDSKTEIGNASNSTDKVSSHVDRAILLSEELKVILENK